jgi:superfamily I DNA/RNA helicase
MSYHSFKTWLETEITFGQITKGKDHTQIDDSYLNWMLTKIGLVRHFPKEQQQIIIDYLDKKGKLTQTSRDAIAIKGLQPTQQAQQTQATQQPQQVQTTQKPWIYAKTLRTKPSVFQKDTDIALQQQPNKQWSFINLTTKKTGELTSDEVTNKTEPLIQSYRNQNDKTLTSPNPSLEDLYNQLGQPIPEQEKPKTKQKQRMIPDDKISDEQKKIVDRFGETLNGKGGHMMISALAGTGKTTLLVDLAWRYGKPGQKWLYIVFNKKNRVEAKGKFPLEWVEPMTSNGFLGNLLQSTENKGRIPSTQRSAELGDDKFKKTRIIVDGLAFEKLIHALHMPSSPPCPNCGGHLIEQQAKVKTKDLYCPQCKTEPYRESWQKNSIVGNTIIGLLRQLQYTFKERVIKLTDLAKATNLTPLKQQELKAGLDHILTDHDIDTTLEEVKDRIAKWKSASYTQKIIDHLKDILHYNIMSKDYAEEIKTGTTWLLGDSLPGKSQQEYEKNGIKYSLSKYRDFDDDLWYTAMHADELHWPKYDVVLADEVQDFNEAQQIMLKKLAQQGAKIVAVGDKNQAIYRFRGADAEAFQKLSNSLTDWSSDKQNVVYEITKNFRSKPEILKFAETETGIQGLQSGKEWAPDDQGIVTNQEQKYEDLFNNINNERDKGNKIETAFISRTNEPLVHAALKLLAQGTPFVIIGKDISKDLKKHIKKMVRLGINDNSRCDELDNQLQSHLADEQNTFGNKSAKTAYLSGLKEVTDALSASLQQFMTTNTGTCTVREFTQWIESKLGGLDIEEGSENDIEKNLAQYEERMALEKPIVLTTAHRSKGLEFDRVYLLRYDQFPHPKTLKKRLPKDMAQENNMKYVAITRGRNEVHVVKNNGQPGYKPPTPGH